MKVKELIEKLQEFDDDDFVYILDNEKGSPLKLIRGDRPRASVLTDLVETIYKDVFLY